MQGNGGDQGSAVAGHSLHGKPNYIYTDVAAANEQLLGQ